MKRYISKKRHVIEYTVPVYVYCKQYEQPIAAQEFVDTNPEDLIKNIAEKVANNVEAYGFELINSQQIDSNKSEAQCVRFKVPSSFLKDASITLIIAIIFRFAEHKSNKGFMKNFNDTMKHKQGNMLLTVAVWFDVAGITKQSTLQLMEYIACILTELSKGSTATLLALPKCVKKEQWM